MPLTTRSHPSDLEEDRHGDVVEMQPTRSAKRRRVHMEDVRHLNDLEPSDDLGDSGSGRADGHRSGSGSPLGTGSGSGGTGQGGKPSKHTVNTQEDSLAHADLLIESETRKRAHSIGNPNKLQRTTSRETPNGTPDTASSVRQASLPPPPPSHLRTLLNHILSSRHISWILPRLSSFELMKPVIRSTISAWLGLIFLLVYRTESILGQAGFFALVVACILPPALPFIQTVEQIFYLFLFVGTSWAWCVLAAFISIQVRTGTVDQAYLNAEDQKYPGLAATNPEQFAKALIFDGTYLEPASSAVCIVFLGILVAFFAWYKIHTAPAPWTFACVLACILADVSLTIVPLFPTPYYTSGLLFMLPMSVQCGLHIVCSIFVFPQSVSSAFVTHLDGVLAPLSSATDLLEALFQDGDERHNARLSRQPSNRPELNDGFMPIPTFGNGEDERSAAEIEEDLNNWAEQGKLVRTKMLDSVAGLGPLKAKEHYLTKELTFGRLKGDDLVELSQLVQVLQLRSGGMVFFFDVVSQAISHSHLNSKAFEVHTPVESRGPSRPASTAPSRRTSREHLSTLHDPEEMSRHPPSEYEHTSGDADSVTSSRRESNLDSWHRPHSFKLSKKVHLNAIWPQGHTSPHHHNDKPLSGADRNSSHLSLLESLRKIQQPVGIYESQRYMNVEREQDTDAQHVSIQLELLAQAALPLVTEMSLALKESMTWLKRVNKQRSMWRAMMKKQKEAQMQKDGATALADRLKALDEILQDFKTSRRFMTMEPYLHLFDPSHPPSEDIDYRKLPHRALFWDCLATYHLIEYSTALRDTVRKMQGLDEERSHPRLWWPRVPLLPSFGKQAEGTGVETDDSGLQEEEEPGHDESLRDHPHLGEVKRRNPDVQPYGTPFLDSLRYVHKGFSFFTKRDFLFALKAGVLTCLVALPSVIRSSAHFFYYNRGLWVIIMSQMTLSLYAGETAVAWVARAQGTFFGCLVGMLMWYIASGSGRGNVYGLGAVCAVGFPMLFMVRIYYPASPLVVIIFTVSAGLVVGYSWVNSTLIQTTNATWGWDVAWRRFVTVLIGITAAWIFALLPPTASGKEEVRRSYARMIAQIGTIWCDIVSEANDEHMPANPEQHLIRERVLAMKRKLAKTGARHNAIKFEFSLRGRWPIERYQALQDVCVDIVALLSQMHHVLAGMPYPWRRALLERVKLLDHRFLGECLAVITMCSTSLRAGTPLPQITPGPLVERLLERHYGVAVTLDSNETKEIPHLVTSDVLKSEEYLSYALGTTTCFSIIRRFDKLLLIVKTLVGEDYHIAVDMQEKLA